MVYYLLIALLVILANADFDRHKSTLLVDKSSNYRMSFQTCIVVLILVASFRAYNIGLDTMTYKFVYYNNANGIGHTGFELFFDLLFNICNALSLDYSVVISIFSIVCYTLAANYIYKNSINPVFSLLLFVTLGIYAQTLNIMRQALAIIVCLYSVKYIKTGEFIKFIGVIFIALLCHATALIFIPAYFVRYFKLNKYTISFAVLFTCAMSILLPIISKFISGFTTVDYYGRYFEDTYYQNEVSLLAILFTLGLFAIFIIMYANRDKLNNAQGDNKFNIFLKLYFISTLLRIFALFTPAPEVIGRLALFYFIYCIFLIPYFIEFGLVGKKNIWTNLVIFASLIYYVALIEVKKSCGITPYAFIWDRDVILTILFYVIFAVLSVIAIRLIGLRYKEERL